MVAQAVAHPTKVREVVGLIPAGSWAFFSLLYPIRSVSFIRSLVEVQHYLFSSIKCLAVQFEAKQA